MGPEEDGFSDGSAVDVVGYDGGSFNCVVIVSETVAPGFVPPPLIVPVIRRARFILFLYARQVLCLRDRCTVQFISLERIASSKTTNSII